MRIYRQSAGYEIANARCFQCNNQGFEAREFHRSEIIELLPAMGYRAFPDCIGSMPALGNLISAARVVAEGQSAALKQCACHGLECDAGRLRCHAE